MSDFIAMDYNKLPEPEIIQTVDEVKTKKELKAVFLKVFPEYSADIESDLGRMLLEVLTYIQIKNTAQLNYNGIQNFAALATGANQDHEAANWGVKRQFEVITDQNGNEQIIYEDDDSLRRRRLLAPEAITTAGSTGAYLYHIYTAGEKPFKAEIEALKDDKISVIYDLPTNGMASKIKHAAVMTPAPGVVHFSFIVKDIASQPNEELAAQVLKNLQQGDIKPLTDKVEYIEPIALEFELHIKIYLKDGVTKEIIEPTIKSNFVNYLEECRRLGSLVDLAGIHAACRISDVFDVDVEGFEDLQAGWNEYPICKMISIDYIEPQHNRPSWQDNWRGGNE